MKKASVLLLLVVVSLTSCSKDNGPYNEGVYMLVDTSGTYTNELTQAQRIINFILAKLNPGDTFAVAQVNTGSFTEKDIVHKQTFDDRPSMANEQKRKFSDAITKFIKGVKPSAYTDITGGLLQAIEYLNEANTGRKVILICFVLTDPDFHTAVKNTTVYAVFSIFLQLPLSCTCTCREAS